MAINENGNNVLPFVRPATASIGAKGGKNASRKVPTKKIEASPDGETIRLLHLAQDIDAVILRYLGDGKVEAKDIAGVISHRLGALVRHLEEREHLVDVCSEVFKKQAAVE